MKKGFLILLLAGSFSADAQSLKEALYGGKLKNDPGTVIRKGDDLSTKLPDTTKKAAPEEVVKTTTSPVVADSLAVKVTLNTDSAVAVAGVTNTGTEAATTAAAAPAPVEPVAAPKDNNVIWKGYMDSLATTLKTEVLSSKKVKSGSYYVLVSYSIGTDGQVTVGDVFLSPESEFLQQQIKQRLSFDTPRLTPVLSSSGAPRKVSKKYNFTIVKD